MGFNWKVVAFYMGLVIASGFAFPLIGLTPAQANLMFAITCVVFLLLLLAVSPVARHNMRQMVRGNGHQWIGDGKTCEECDERN